MKGLPATLLLLVAFSFGSCTSEYEERLDEAKKLHHKLSLIEESNFISPDDELVNEMNAIEKRIEFLAKVSGNEESFLQEIYGNN